MDASFTMNENMNENKLDFLNKIHLDENDKPCYSFIVSKNEQHLPKLFSSENNAFYELTQKYDLRYLWYYFDEKKISIWTKTNDVELCKKIELEILGKINTFEPDHKERIDFEKDIVCRLIGVGGRFFKEDLKKIDSENIQKIYFDPDIQSICIFLNNNCSDEEKKELIKKIQIDIYIKIHDIIVCDFKNSKVNINKDLYTWAKNFQRYYKNKCVGQIPTRKYTTTILKKNDTASNFKSNEGDNMIKTEDKDNKSEVLINNENPKFNE